MAKLINPTIMTVNQKPNIKTESKGAKPTRKNSSLSPTYGAGKINNGSTAKSECK